MFASVVGGGVFCAAEVGDGAVAVALAVAIGLVVAVAVAPTDTGVAFEVEVGDAPTVGTVVELGSSDESVPLPQAETRAASDSTLAMRSGVRRIVVAPSMFPHPVFRAG